MRAWCAGSAHVLRTGAGEVGERKQCGCDAEAYAYDAKSLAEKSFYEILEKQSYDSYRDAAYENFEHVVEIVVATECKERHAERFELMPQHDYGAEHSGYMEHHVELETFRSRQFESEKVAAYFKVSA